MRETKDSQRHDILLGEIQEVKNLIMVVPQSQVRAALSFATNSQGRDSKSTLAKYSYSL